MTDFSKTMKKMVACILSIQMQFSSAAISFANPIHPETDSNKPAFVFQTDYGQQLRNNEIPVIKSGTNISCIPVAVSIATLSVSAILFISAFRARKRIKTEREKLLEEKESDNTAIHNLANELKTPLSMIYNPVKNIIESGRTDIITRTRLEAVLRQTDIMTRMVNIIMEETDEGIEKKGVNTESVELNKWIDYLADEFMVNNESRNIVIKSEPDPSIDTVILDKEITSEAFYAVLECIVSYCNDDCALTLRTMERKGYYLLSVECRNVDLPIDKEKLFETKSPGKKDATFPENGRNLSTARIRMNLMGGDIMIRSGSNQSGIVFHIKIPAIPISETSLTEELVRPYRYESGNAIHEINDGNPEVETTNASLLIADDQQDLLDYMKGELRPLFKNIYTEPDGKQALETITAKMPDIVISDIMMPRMNGFDLCRKIKSDPELSHIPVILLTSRTNPKVQEMGYKIGADAYLSKPFDLNLLYKMICSQIKNRQEIRKQYSGKLFSNITENMTHCVADEQFVVKLNKLIKENIDNPKLDVSFLVEKLCMSRTSLFLKTNNLLGISAGRYIKQLRMEAAKELLTKTDKQINEIAACTGFSESQYFSTVFKQETGMTPKQFKEMSVLKKI